MFAKLMTFFTGLVFGMWLMAWTIEHPTKAQVEPARLWSKLCTKRDLDFIARQADGKKWKIDCVKPGVRL